MTILGDRAQTIGEKMQDVLRFLPKIFGKNICKIEMNKSYRNTIEIARYAEPMNGVSGIEYIKRHGKEVEEMQLSTWEDAVEAVLKRVNVSTGVIGDPEVEPYETAAVLTMTEEEARKVYEYLKKKREDVFYIDRDSSNFRKGITVTTFYMAKGLEFDQVFVAGGTQDHPFFRQFRYICATRALHELYIMDIKEDSY